MTAPQMRFFIDGVEVTEDYAKASEANGTARVQMGGSGVVPPSLRKEGETREQFLVPWCAMETVHPEDQAAAWESRCTDDCPEDCQADHRGEE